MTIYYLLLPSMLLPIIASQFTSFVLRLSLDVSTESIVDSSSNVSCTAEIRMF